MTLAASGDEVAQEAAAECFCSAASFDGGRALLGPVIESGVIFALMESKSQAARSAAARQVRQQVLDGVCVRGRLLCWHQCHRQWDSRLPKEKAR